MKNLVNKIERDDSRYADKYDWEHHCGACDWFGDAEKCPFFELVIAETYYEDLNCQSFWD